jgi:hypothetical protein
VPQLEQVGVQSKQGAITSIESDFAVILSYRTSGMEFSGTTSGFKSAIADNGFL